MAPQSLAAGLLVCPVRYRDHTTPGTELSPGRQYLRKPPEKRDAGKPQTAKVMADKADATWGDH